MSRSRRWSLRRIFLTAMLLFGIVDACLVVTYLGASFLQPRVAGTAQRNPTRAATLVARQPTAGTRVTRTVVPTQAPPAATRRPTTAPTAVRPPTVAPTAPPPTEVTLPGRTLPVGLPATLNLAALQVEIPNEPANCTPAAAMPDVVDRSVKLCPGETYRPFLLRGDHIGVFGDKSSVIRSQGRGYGIIAEGSHLFIQNVMVRGSTDGGDTNTFLCLYPDCRGSAGGVAYGGGILVRASDTTVMDSDVAGGVIGIAAEHVRNLRLIRNRLDDSSGWGSYNFAVEASYFVENSYSRDNRSCNTDSGFLPTGCESWDGSALPARKM